MTMQRKILRRQNNHAFTLVELMLAATITTVVIGGALVSLSSMLQAYKIITSGGKHAGTARFIFERMGKDLAAAFYSPHDANTRFVCQDLTVNGLPADNLTFISTVNKPTETGDGTSDIVEIQYYIDGDNATPEKWLQRRYDPTPDMDPFSGGMTALLGPHVLYLDFQFYDGELWWPQWDTVEEIPILANITIGFFTPSRIDQQPMPEDIEQYSSLVRLVHYREPPSDSLGPVGGTESLYRDAAAEQQGNG